MSLKQILCFLLLFFGFNSLVFAQDPFSFPYTVKKYTVDDGLTANSINGLVQDDNGYIWIGTSGGLNRFDGLTFEGIDLPIDSTTNSADTYIVQLQKNGSSILIETKSKFYEYKITTETIESLNFTKKGSERSFQFFTFSDSLYSISGNIKSRFSFFSSNNKTVIPDSISSYFIHRDTLWTITQSDLIKIAPDFSVERIPHHFPLQRSNDNIYLKKKRDGIGFWVYSRLNSEILHSKNEHPIFIEVNFSSLSKFRELSEPISNQIQKLDFYSFYEDHLNRLWIITQFEGLFIADLKNNTLLNATQIPSLTSEFNQFLVRGIVEINNQLWIFGNGTGLIQIDLKPKQFLTIPINSQFGDVTISNLTKRVWSLDNQLWFVNHNKPFSLNHIDLNTWKGNSYRFKKNGRELALADAYSSDNYHFFIGNIDSQLNYFDLKKKKLSDIYSLNEKAKLNNGFHSDFSAVASRGFTKNPWFGNRYRFFQLDSQLKPFHIIEIKDSLYYGNFLWQMNAVTDSLRNGVWFTQGGVLGFHSFSTNENTYTPFKEIDNNDLKHIEIIHRNDNLNQNLWICSENGLIYFEPETKRTRFFDKRNGLPDNFIYGMLIDKSNHLWFSTNRGLSKATVILDSLGLPVLSFKNYTVKDGLQSNEFNSFGYSQDDKGRFWFSGVGGINVFYPDSIRDEETTPKPIVKDIFVSNFPFISDSSASVKKHLILNHEDRDLSIEYAGIYFKRADEVAYAYQLVGFDKNWIHVGKETRVRYTNLKLGLYEFKLKTANFDGVWSKPISLWITVLAPFWLSWWFISLFIFFAISVIISLVKYFSALKLKKLIRELEKKELINKERTRIAQDLHDEIGANLTQIALLSELISRHEDENKISKSNLPFSKIAEAVKSSVTNLSEIVWSLNPKHDDLENVATYIQEYTESFFAYSSIRILFDIQEKLPALSIESDLRHALLMSIKEVLNNALKYSEANTIWLHLSTNNQKLHITIQDNGKGFDLEQEYHKGNGIKHILTRLRRYNGNTRIETSPDYGCTVHFELGLN